ncbi:hypothetical protein B0T25DRAFT_560343 [Lasiosphaeria hispida]|uniref:Uncharacterized protein n=1 Tax=Lasiosphaeria hispida TaxID=260671 RepID=A0AAJ0H4Z8_9PEZI|nr:hypothetical protein B0T25DRAFT_560343 [Lasiosphaeria hispida]
MDYSDTLRDPLLIPLTTVRPEAASTPPAPSPVVQLPTYTGEEQTFAAPASEPTPAAKPVLSARPNQEPSQWSSFQRQLDDGWGSELLAALLSMISFVSIAITLKVYEGHELPQLPADITLNTLISILSTIAKSLLIYAVSAAIGQSKWDWYDERPHMLADLETFDEASRGPLGAVMVLFGPTRRSIASIGAVVVILALAVDPFVQQVVDYNTEYQYLTSDQVSVERVRAPVFLPDPDQPPDTAYLNAISGSIWNDVSVYDRPAQCSSGNCSISSYQSMEWCVDSNVVEDPSRLEVDCGIAFNKTDFDVIYKQYTQTGAENLGTQTRNCTIYMGPNRTSPLTYPIEFSLKANGNGQGAPTNPGYEEPSFITTFPTTIIAPMYIGGSRNESVLHIPNPVLAMGYASFTVNQDKDNTSVPQTMTLSQAEYAILTLCRVTRSLTVLNGTTYTSIEASMYGTLYPDDTTALGKGAVCWSPSGEVGPNKPMGPPQTLPNGVQFISNTTTLSFCTKTFHYGADVSDRLSSHTLFRKRQVVYPNGDSDNVTSYWESAGQTASKDVYDQINARTLPDVMDSMAAALNNLTHALSLDDRVTGGFIGYPTVLRVRWPWLVLPFVFEGLGVVFLILATMSSCMGRRRGKTRKVAGLWKDSVLAVVFHGLAVKGGVGVMGTGKMETLSDMREAAEAAEVKLWVGERGERVALGQCP